MKEYLGRLQSGLSSLNYDALEQAISLISDDSTPRNIFLAGNGGSAAIVAHFGTDLFKSFEQRGVRNRLINLTDWVSLNLATANDYGYERIFERVLKQMARANDVAVVISSSGNSRNVVNMVEACQQLDVKTIAITGFDGGKIHTIANLSIRIATEIGDYGVAEDVSSVVCHYIAERIKC